MHAVYDVLLWEACNATSDKLADTIIDIVRKIVASSGKGQLCT